MTERVDAAVRRILRDDPTIDVRYTFALRPDSFHQGTGILFLHPCHEVVVAEVRAQSRGTMSAAPRVAVCELCGHARVGLRPGTFARVTGQTLPGRRHSAATCATFEYDGTPSMHRHFCRCSGPAHQTRLVGREDAIEASAPSW